MQDKKPNFAIKPRSNKPNQSKKSYREDSRHDSHSRPFPLSHFRETGEASMVNIGAKPSSQREATAQASLQLGEEVYNALVDKKVAKGDALAVARIAGIQAAKKTPELIPLCHQVALDHVFVDFVFQPEKSAVIIKATARTMSKTGVEMEALVAASTAALTLYDMCKAMSKSIRITSTFLVHKSGGKNGDYHAPSHNSTYSQAKFGETRSRTHSENTFHNPYIRHQRDFSSKRHRLNTVDLQED